MPYFNKNIRNILLVAGFLFIVAVFITVKDKYLTNGKKQIERGDEMLMKGRLNDAFYWYYLVREGDNFYPVALKKRYLIDSLKAIETK